MRNSLILVKAFAIVMILATFNQSCTNLDEELYSQVTPENFFQTEEEILSAMGAAYSQFGNLASGDMTMGDFNERAAREDKKLS